MKVYCDTGGFRRELRSLERQGRVALVMFPYENVNGKIDDAGQPSQANYGDFENFDWETLPGIFGDYGGSERYPEIERIVGSRNRRDILHLDSAFKSKCDVFLTRDKGDIIAVRSQLQTLLGLKIFHSDEDWKVFVSLLHQVGG